ncbi:hypothetical protein RintRC_0512 [Richelia intracellularis]|nr:hypothetical protein RintRC_0512 [Richelia intracellularis]
MLFAPIVVRYTIFLSIQVNLIRCNGVSGVHLLNHDFIPLIAEGDNMPVK